MLAIKNTSIVAQKYAQWHQTNAEKPLSVSSNDSFFAKVGGSMSTCASTGAYGTTQLLGTVLSGSTKLVQGALAVAAYVLAFPAALIGIAVGAVMGLTSGEGVWANVKGGAKAAHVVASNALFQTAQGPLNLVRGVGEVAVAAGGVAGSTVGGALGLVLGLPMALFV